MSTIMANKNCQSWGPGQSSQCPRASATLAFSAWDTMAPSQKLNGDRMWKQQTGALLEQDKTNASARAWEQCEKRSEMRWNVLNNEENSNPPSLSVYPNSLSGGPRIPFPNKIQVRNLVAPIEGAWRFKPGIVAIHHCRMGRIAHKSSVSSNYAFS